MKLTSLLIALLVLGACSRSSPSKPNAAASATGASADAAVDAGPTTDLLWSTYALVAVSSRVNNPRDIPDHLADHNEGTAWNGKSGDLVGAWISFRVPVDAHVAYVMMSSGFDKQNEKEDLFLGNYRITKVRIFRSGSLLRDATLSADVRTPQRIDVDAAGGDFKIEVAEVMPGTHAGWREIVVSELGVFGTAGARVRLEPARPLVVVGSLDLREVDFQKTAAASYDAACKKWIDDDTQAANESCIDDKDRQIEGAATCAPSAVSAASDAGVEVAHVTIGEAPTCMYGQQFHGDVVALKSGDKVALTNVRTSGRETAMYWTVTYQLRSEKWVGSDFVVDVDELRITDSDGYAPPGHESDLHSEDHSTVHTICHSLTLECVSATTQ